uniref:MerR family transcriptional regulator n=1 Tax=Streptomyces sp. NBC_00049 TaxID=2903617 RepID=A0AAU2K2Q4_9ACTN
MQLTQVTGCGRASREQQSGVSGSLVQQVAQLGEVSGRVREIGQAVQCSLVALVGQLAEGLPINIRVVHDAMLQPCPRGKVKWDDGRVITIGQLAGYIGVSIKTVRVYHDKGLLPEPDRDASGYRRYGASDAVALIKIRTLAEAGVPLARIRDLRASGEEELRQALGEIDDELGARIRRLQETQARLRQLAAGRLVPLPDEVASHLEDLARWGFTSRWVDLQRDLWILVFATHPDRATTLFHDQADILADPKLRQLFLGYDHAHDLDADDPRLDDLARRIAEANRERYGSGELPGLDADSEIPALIQGTVNASSPAWERLDSLIRAHLNA